MRAGEQRGWRALDGIRAFAALTVIGFHLAAAGGPLKGVLSGGFLGVDVFFVLSGFLITRLLVDEVASTARIGLLRFYLRRLLRLFPPLALIVAATTAMVAWWPAMLPYRHATESAALFVITYTINMRGCFNPSAGLMGHLWSLATEEQWYLAWAPLLALLLWGRVRRPLMAAGLVLAAAGEVVAKAAVYFSSPDKDLERGLQQLYFRPQFHSEGLLIGAALALLLEVGHRPVPKRAGAAVAIPAALGVAGLGALVVAASPTGGQVVWAPAAASVATVPVIVLGVLRSRSLPARLLGCRPIRWVGIRSYAVYLWHYPLVGAVVVGPIGHRPWVAYCTVYAGALVAGGLSYRFVEAPVLRFRARVLSSRQPAHAAVRGRTTSPLDAVVGHPLWAWPLQLDLGQPAGTVGSQSTTAAPGRRRRGT